MSQFIQFAWKTLWAQTVAGQGQDYRASHGHFVTASDLANTLRDQITGHQYYASPAGGKWLDAARNWLSAEVRAGRLQAHNFGRGHISGMRYRPVGEVVTATEQATVAAKERSRDRPRLVHFSKHGFGGPLLCTASRRGRFSYRTNSRSTKEQANVTCPRCQKMMENAS
jgi:hypothetical protein